MSVDKDVTENVMEILEDGRDGFNDAAEKLRDSSRPDLAPRFEAFAAQRGQFYTELEQMAAAYGDDLDESGGSVRATMHRAWMAVKDTLSGDSPEGILDAAEQGEDHAVEAYEDGLKHDVSPNLRTVLERQLADVRRTHDEVKTLRNAAD